VRSWRDLLAIAKFLVNPRLLYLSLVPIPFVVNKITTITEVWRIFFIFYVQCQIELPKLVSELDSNQLVTSSLLTELYYFLEAEHQLIDNYRAAYIAGNTSLENVANGIPYDVITSTVATKKVFDFVLLFSVGNRNIYVPSVFGLTRP